MNTANATSERAPAAPYSAAERDALLARFADATAEDITAGREWYGRARKTARRMAREYGVPFKTAAAVIAVLSPRLRWAANLDAAERMLRDGDCVGVFGANKRKARALIDGGQHAEYVRGDKVTAFYRAIVGDDVPVADVWMLRAAGYDVEALSSAEYRRAQGTVAAAIAACAAEVGERVVCFQATVWTVVRGRAD